MEVYIVIRGFPNANRPSFLKTTKDKVLSSLPMMGLLTKMQVQQIGGMLLTMAPDDKIVLYRKTVDKGLEFMSVGLHSEVYEALTSPQETHEHVLSIDRDTHFSVEDYHHRDRVTYFPRHTTTTRS